MPVEGFARTGTASLFITGDGVLTKRDKPNVIARLKPGFAPHVWIQTSFGVADNGAWGVIEVNPQGEVSVDHQYGPEQFTWTHIAVSVTFAY